MRIGTSIVVAIMNAFLAGFFLAQYLSRSGGAAAAPTTWLVLTMAFAALSMWRARMIVRVMNRVVNQRR